MRSKKMDQDKVVILIPMRFLIRAIRGEFENCEEKEKFVDELYKMNLYYVERYNSGEPIQDNILAWA